MSRARGCSKGCAIWWTWQDPDTKDFYGAAYCERRGWHAVNLGYPIRRARTSGSERRP